MCFFKKKKKEIIPSLYKIGDAVQFKDRYGDMCVGYVYNIYKNSEGKIIYDVQIGGECPVVLNGYKEEELRLKR